MRFNSVRSSDYSQSARAVSKASDQIFDAAISGKPDFTKISQEAIKGRSLERRTATEAEGRVAQAGIKAAADVRRTRMKADTAEKVSDIKRPAKRMAGVVAGLGAISQAAVMHKNLKEDKAERAELRRLDQQNFDAKLEMLRNDSATSKALIEQLKNGLTPLDTPKPPAASGSTNVSVDSPPSPSPSPSPSSSSQAVQTVAPVDGEGTGMRYMRHLTSNGFSPTQAAAMVGHLDYESDGFRAMEEYGENHLGTRGYGHLQWTNIPGNFKPGGQRRTDFENWSKSNKLNPSSFEANSGFLLHEFNNGQGVWTGGGNASDFYQINDLTSASDYLRNNYIRPSKGSEAERIRRGQQYLNQFNNQ